MQITLPFNRNKDKTSTNRMQQKKSLQSKNAKEESLVQNTERQQNRIPMTRSTGKWEARFIVFSE